jgi:RNA polymerase sigma factor (sigma-70 family)
MSSTATGDLSTTLKRLYRSRSDQAAWDLLYTQLWPLLVGINYRILRGHRELAEDASQEAFLKIFRYVHFGDFVEKPEEFRSYVRAICRNVSRTYLSRLLKEPSFSQTELDTEPERPAGFSGRDEELAALERDALAHLMNRLSLEDQRLVALLQQGADLGEIAQSLGISYSNAAVRLHRLRQRLSKSMNTKEIDSQKKGVKMERNQRFMLLKTGMLSF